MKSSEANNNDEGYQCQVGIAIMGQMREEILSRLKNTQILLIEMLVLSISLAEASFIHGPMSILLLLPGSVLYFMLQIWEQYVMITTIGYFLKDEVEPKLEKLTYIVG